MISDSLSAASSSDDERDLQPQKRIKRNLKKNEMRVFLRFRPCGQDEPRGPIGANEEERRLQGISKDEYLNSRVDEFRGLIFNRIFCESASQNEFYNEVIQPILPDVFKEKKSSVVFAYGVTNSGKTHSILGSKQSLSFGEGDGILPRMLRFLVESKKWIGNRLIQKIEFQHEPFFGNSTQQSTEFFEIDGIQIDFQNLYTHHSNSTLKLRDIKILFENFEIYNEDIFDLQGDTKVPLDTMNFTEKKSCSRQGSASKKKLQLKEDLNKHVFIKDLITQEVSNIEDAERLIKTAVENRRVRNNSINSASSRSQCCFKIRVKFYYSHPFLNVEEEANLLVIDLAGAERAKKTLNTGAKMTESCHINKALLSLGNCIRALRNGDESIPYRDSKLTRVLREYFVDKNNVLMIVHLHPGINYFDENINVLKYAAIGLEAKLKAEKQIFDNKFSLLLESGSKKLDRSMQSVNSQDKYGASKENFNSNYCLDNLLYEDLDHHLENQHISIEVDKKIEEKMRELEEKKQHLQLKEIILQQKLALDKFDMNFECTLESERAKLQMEKEILSRFRLLENQHQFNRNLSESKEMVEVDEPSSSHKKQSQGKQIIQAADSQPIQNFHSIMNGIITPPRLSRKFDEFVDESPIQSQDEEEKKASNHHQEDNFNDQKEEGLIKRFSQFSIRENSEVNKRLSADTLITNRNSNLEQINNQKDIQQNEIEQQINQNELARQTSKLIKEQNINHIGYNQTDIQPFQIQSIDIENQIQEPIQEQEYEYEREKSGQMARLKEHLKQMIQEQHPIPKNECLNPQSEFEEEKLNEGFISSSSEGENGINDERQNESKLIDLSILSNTQRNEYPSVTNKSNQSPHISQFQVDSQKMDQLEQKVRELQVEVEQQQIFLNMRENSIQEQERELNSLKQQLEENFESQKKLIQQNLLSSQQVKEILAAQELKIQEETSRIEELSMKLTVEIESLKKDKMEMEVIQETIKSQQVTPSKLSFNRCNSIDSKSHVYFDLNKDQEEKSQNPMLGSNGRKNSDTIYPGHPQKSFVEKQIQTSAIRSNKPTLTNSSQVDMGVYTYYSFCEANNQTNNQNNLGNSQSQGIGSNVKCNKSKVASNSNIKESQSKGQKAIEISPGKSQGQKKIAEGEQNKNQLDSIKEQDLVEVNKYHSNPLVEKQAIHQSEVENIDDKRQRGQRKHHKKQSKNNSASIPEDSLIEFVEKVKENMSLNIKEEGEKFEKNIQNEEKEDEDIEKERKRGRQRQRTRSSTRNSSNSISTPTQSKSQKATKNNKKTNKSKPRKNSKSSSSKEGNPKRNTSKIQNKKNKGRK